MKLYITSPSNIPSGTVIAALDDWNQNTEWSAVSALRLVKEPGRERCDLMIGNFTHLLMCDAIAVFDNWHLDNDVCLEVAIARNAGLPIMHAIHKTEYRYSGGIYIRSDD